MKILITGGSGFLGSNFIEKYGGKYDITAPSSAQVDLSRVEAVTELMRARRFDAVVHAAGKADGRSGNALEADNLILFKNVQYAAILSGVKKLLVLGDAADLDQSKPQCAVKESDFGQSIPSDGYGLGRYLIHLLAGKDKISTVLRFFSVYGKGANVATNKLNEILSHAVTGKKTVELPPARAFSTLYIEDACKIIDAFLENDFPRGAYNVAQDKPATYADFAKSARSYAKKLDRELTLVQAAGEGNELTADTQKLRAVLPNFRFTALSTGMTKTLDHLAAHKSQCRPRPPKESGRA